MRGYLDRYPHHTLESLSRSQYIGATLAAPESYLEGLYFLSKESAGEGNSTRNSEIERLVNGSKGCLGTAMSTLFSNTRYGWRILCRKC